VQSTFAVAVQSVTAFALDMVTQPRGALRSLIPVMASRAGVKSREFDDLAAARLQLRDQTPKNGAASA